MITRVFWRIVDLYKTNYIIKPFLTFFLLLWKKEEEEEAFIERCILRFHVRVHSKHLTVLSCFFHLFVYNALDVNNRNTRTHTHTHTHHTTHTHTHTHTPHTHHTEGQGVGWVATKGGTLQVYPHLRRQRVLCFLGPADIQLRMLAEKPHGVHRGVDPAAALCGPAVLWNTTTAWVVMSVPGLWEWSTSGHCCI